MNLATQKGLKVKEMGDKLEVSGNVKGYGLNPCSSKT